MTGVGGQDFFGPQPQRPHREHGDADRLKDRALHRRIDEASFRRIVLVLLLLSGVMLVIPALRS